LTIDTTYNIAAPKQKLLV